ncbi:MAG: DUF5052 domain-containing protein [Clostridia bacterium]|nr:DUF5052 domain-containing protein [Clostridia bacterium]
MIALLIVMCTGCESWKRAKKSWSSEMNGLNRVVNVYSYNGKLIATYEGKIDLEENENKVLFDLNGKRYVYYNAFVEVIEK